MSDDGHEALRDQVRIRYALAAASVLDTGVAGAGDGACCTGDGGADGGADDGSSAGLTALEDDDRFGSARYGSIERAELPVAAVTASLGCGNPTAVAQLRAGERVLDLGSGGGIDVLLSAGRVGPTGFVYGVDMTEEMLTLARANANRAGATNVEFLSGTIEDVPLADAAVDVVISNCVINLSTDKAAVIAEMFRVLAPGGWIGVSDVVADDELTPEQRAERGSYVGCIAGALSTSEYLADLTRSGFVDASVRFTHQVADGMHAAIIRASKPGRDS